MKSGTRLFSRAVITPIAAALFFIVAVTGVLLLVHVRSGAVEEFHTWMSVLFVIFGVLHLALNWRVFVSYTKKPVMVGLGVLCVALLVFIVAGGDFESPHGPGGGGVLRRIETAPLGDVAPLLGISVDDAAAMLRDRGLGVTGEEQTIDDIARSNGRRPQEVLSVLALGDQEAEEL